VVHGDLGGENVLWETTDGAPRPGGVRDEVSIGDPADDLAAVGASYDEALLGRVLALGGWADTGAAGGRRMSGSPASRPRAGANDDAGAPMTTPAYPRGNRPSARAAAK